VRKVFTDLPKYDKDTLDDMLLNYLFAPEVTVLGREALPPPHSRHPRGRSEEGTRPRPSTGPGTRITLHIRTALELHRGGVVLPLGGETRSISYIQQVRGGTVSFQSLFLHTNFSESHRRQEPGR
jgi:hypothetical protein